MGSEVFTRKATRQNVPKADSGNVVINVHAKLYADFDKVPILLSETDRNKWSSEFNKLEVMRHLAAKIELSDECIVRCVIQKIADFHRGGMGVSALNGAIISSLLDCVVAVSGVLQFPGKKAGTVELSLKIIRPLFGGSAYAEGFVTKKAKNISFSEGFLYDQNGRLCARASGIVSAA